MRLMVAERLGLWLPHTIFAIDLGRHQVFNESTFLRRKKEESLFFAMAPSAVVVSLQRALHGNDNPTGRPLRTSGKPFHSMHPPPTAVLLLTPYRAAPDIHVKAPTVGQRDQPPEPTATIDSQPLAGRAISSTSQRHSAAKSTDLIVWWHLPFQSANFILLIVMSQHSVFVVSVLAVPQQQSIAASNGISLAMLPPSKDAPPFDAPCMQFIHLGSNAMRRRRQFGVCWDE